MFYLGMDVAKAKLDCCLLLDEAGSKRKTKVVPNSKAGIAAFLEWTTKQGVSIPQSHVVMEATGVYHEQAAKALADTGVTVSIINPAQVKDLGRGLAVRTKTDGVDSAVLARYGALLKPAPWQPPPHEARILQALLARRDAVAEDLRRERNRQEKAEVTDTPPLIVQSITASIGFLEAELKRLQRAIDEHIDHHPDLKRDMALLTSIPAVGERVGNNLLAVMHAHHFESAEQVAAYSGLVPVERQSGSSVLGRARLMELLAIRLGCQKTPAKSLVMSKAGPARVRGILYMAAVVATRCNPHVKALYERLLARGDVKDVSIGCGDA
jgi:transposase